MRTPFTPGAAWESLKATFGLDPADGTGIALLFGVSACADLGASAAVAGGSLAVKRAQAAVNERRGLDSNHRLIGLVHTARWRAMAVIARDLDTASQDGGDASVSFRTDDWLKQIHKRALEQAERTPGKGRDARDLDRPRKARGKEKQAPDEDAARNAAAAERLLQDLATSLSRDPGNQPPSRQAAAAQSLDALSTMATKAALEDLFAGLKAVSKRSAQPFIARMHDDRLGFAATYRALLKAELDNPDSQAEARRVMVALGAEVFQSTIRLEKLAEGTHSRVQALAGAVDALRDDIAHIETLVRLLSPQIPLGAGWTTAAAGQQRFVELTYDQRATALIGREQEVAKLEGFLAPDPGAEKPVKWWQIAGAGGQGKSRLALELIDLAALDGWRAGFLSGTDLETVNWSGVTIEQPTLIVIDYVAAPAKARGAAHAIAKLWERGDLAHQVRVLLVERAPYSFEATSSQDRAPWFEAFCAIGRPAALTDASQAPQALALPVLSPGDMRAIARSWRQGRGKPALSEAHEARLLNLLGLKDDADGKTIIKDRAWRPLFAMIFANRVAEGATLGPAGEESLSLADALHWTLEDEKQSYWKGENGGPVEPGQPAVNLACLATMARAVPDYHAVLDRNAGGFYGLDAPQAWRDASMVLGVRRADPFTAPAAPGPEPDRAALNGREPDLLGEYMLVWLLGYELRRDNAPRLDALMEDAWRLNPVAALEFLIRLTEDADDLGARDLRDQLARVNPPEGAADIVPGAGDGDRLVFCAFFGLTALVNRLLSKQPALAGYEAENGAFPLLLAAQQGHAECVQLLLDALPEGADLNKENRTNGSFPLLMAAQNGHAECVQLLLDAGAGPAQTHREGAFPLLMAAQEGHAKCVRLLLDALPEGADLNKEDSKDGTFPLFMAAQQSHAECVQLLLDAGADPAKTHTDGGFPLLLAAQQGHAECVRLLLDALPEDADLNKENPKDGTFPLLMAAQNGHAECVQLLLDALPKDADLNKENRTSGNFPLLMAAQQGHAECVRLLLDAGADPAKTHTNGTFPLFLAAGHGHLPVVRQLAEAKADLHKIWQPPGANALDLAIAHNHAAVAAYLWTHGVRPVHEENAGVTISPAGDIIRPAGGD